MGSDVIRVQRLKREIQVSIPLELLGDPERVLASAKTTLVEIPFDYVPWLVIEMEIPEK